MQQIFIEPAEEKYSWDAKAAGRETIFLLVVDT